MMNFSRKLPFILLFCLQSCGENYLNHLNSDGDSSLFNISGILQAGPIERATCIGVKIDEEGEEELQVTDEGLTDSDGKFTLEFNENATDGIDFEIHCKGGRFKEEATGDFVDLPEDGEPLKTLIPNFKREKIKNLNDSGGVGVHEFSDLAAERIKSLKQENLSYEEVKELIDEEFQESFGFRPNALPAHPDKEIDTVSSTSSKFKVAMALASLSERRKQEFCPDSTLDTCDVKFHDAHKLLKMDFRQDGSFDGKVGGTNIDELDDSSLQKAGISIGSIEKIKDSNRQLRDKITNNELTDLKDDLKQKGEDWGRKKNISQDKIDDFKERIKTGEPDAKVDRDKMRQKFGDKYEEKLDRNSENYNPRLDKKSSFYDPLCDEDLASDLTNSDFCKPPSGQDMIKIKIGVETEVDANSERSRRFIEFDIPDESLFKVLKELDKFTDLKEKMLGRDFFNLDKIKQMKDVKDQIGESDIDDDLLKDPTELEKLKDRVKEGQCVRRPQFITQEIDKNIGSACHRSLQCESGFCDMCSWTCQNKPVF